MTSPPAERAYSGSGRAERALAALHSSPRGLSSAEAAERLVRDGRNELPKPPSPWRRGRGRE